MSPIRDIQLQVRCTEAEKLAFEMAAEAGGLMTATWARTELRKAAESFMKDAENKVKRGKK